MTIFSTIGHYFNSWTKTSEQGTPSTPTKLLSEFLIFLAGFPYTQVAGAALAEGTNIPLDITTAAALMTDFVKAFYSGQSAQDATMALTAKIGISPGNAAQIVFSPDPIHPTDPTQFSRGR